MTTEAKQAFLAAIERTHGRQLRRYFATRLSRSTSDVDDLTQEVYLRLLRIDDHETIRSPQAYVFTIASHVLHQHALRSVGAPDSIEMTDALVELNPLDIDPAQQVELEQRFEELGRVIERMSPRAYATLVMHRCDGIPLQDIANRFGVSYSMVKRYLAKALAYCQQHLDTAE